MIRRVLCRSTLPHTQIVGNLRLRQKVLLVSNRPELRNRPIKADAIQTVENSSVPQTASTASDTTAADTPMAQELPRTVMPTTEKKTAQMVVTINSDRMENWGISISALSRKQPPPCKPLGGHREAGQRL